MDSKLNLGPPPAKGVQNTAAKNEKRPAQPSLDQEITISLPEVPIIAAANANDFAHSCLPISEGGSAGIFKKMSVRPDSIIVGTPAACEEIVTTLIKDHKDQCWVRAVICSPNANRGHAGILPAWIASSCSAKTCLF